MNNDFAIICHGFWPEPLNSRRKVVMTFNVQVMQVSGKKVQHDAPTREEANRVMATVLSLDDTKWARMYSVEGVNVTLLHEVKGHGAEVV